MSVNFRGYLFQDDGDAVNGATVQLLETGTTTVEASTTTDSDGLWYFAEADQDRYDVKITSGTSVRYIRWDDQVSFKEIDVRNNTAAGTPTATFTNLTNSTANQVAVFSGANSTKADNDEIYLSFKMHDSAGNLDEFARITVVATDVTSGSEDGQIEFDVLKGGSHIKAFTISSSDAGAQSIDFNQDSITFGTGTAATDITLTFDAESADGVITWMEDEDYFKFSDDILMSTTERINLRDTAIYIYSSTDGQLDLVADTEIQIAATTIDINGAVAFDGALTGITNITLSGTLSDGNYTFDTSGNVSGLGTVGSGAITSSGIIKTDNATEATSTTDGSLQTDGGLSVVKDAVFGDDVKLLSDSAVIALGADGDTTLTHTDGTGLTLNSTNKLTFGDVASFIQQSADGTLRVDGEAIIDLNASTRVDVSVALTVGTDVNIGDDLSLTSDSSVFNMGAGNDFTITHDGSTGATLAGNPITITSAAAATWSTAAGALTIDGDDGITLQTTGSGNVTVAEILDITDATDSSDATGDTGALRTEGGASIAKKLYVGTDLDVDGTTNLDAVDIDGNVQADGTITVGVDNTGYDVKLFGATASAYMLWDASEDDLVLAGAAGIDLAGDIDVDGTANLDAVDIDGAVQIDATFTSGVDGQGYDTKLFGDTSGAYILWDTSADKLLTAGGALVDIVKDKLLIGGTAVTTTAAELNLLDGGTSVGSSITVADADGIVVNDGGTMKTIPASDLKTYAGGTITALNNATANELVTVGATTTELDAETSLTFDGNNMFIATGGGLVVGHTSQEAISTNGVSGLVPEVQILGTATADASIMLAAFSTTATIDAAPIVGLVKGGNASIGSHTVVTDNEILGAIMAYGDDGSDLGAIAAKIHFEVDGTPGTGDMPGAIVFSTTKDGAEVPTESMRIATNGAVIVTDVAVDADWVDIPNNLEGEPAGGDGGRGPGMLISFDYVQDSYSGGIIWRTADSNGDKAKAAIGLQVTSGGSKLFFGTSNGYSTGITNAPYINTVGAFVDSSDSSLKTSVATISNATDTVKAMRGITFNWISGGRADSGFLAQEVETISALAHTVESSRVAGGDKKYINHKSILPYLAMAIKELDARITALE